MRFGQRGQPWYKRDFHNPGRQGKCTTSANSFASAISTPEKSMCMKPALTLTALLAEAAAFCAQARSIPDLFGVTDGKAVGTLLRLREMIKDGANEEDIAAYLSDRNIPADELTLRAMAQHILANPPARGYLTISNALQWRLQYHRVLHLERKIEGIVRVTHSINP